MDQQKATATPALQTLHIGILGGGPAGLTTALALEAYASNTNIRVTLLDRNASASDYPGVEYGIQKRACLAFERIGLLEKALAGGNPCTEVALRNARLSKQFRSISSDPKYTRAVVRQDFLEGLEQLLKRTGVRRRHHVSTVEETPDGRVHVTGDAAGTPFQETFDLLIAADGVHSVVRKAIYPAQARLIDRGFSCIYMLVEADEATAPKGFLERANSGRSELIMGDIATMTLFPLGGGRLAFGIGFEHKVRDQLWLEAGLESDTEWQDIPTQTKAEIARKLTEDSRDTQLVAALNLVPDWDSYKIYVWKMRDADPLQVPYSSNGGILVLGDAAHPIMPTIGMGASLAIEDAEALVRKLKDTGLLDQTPSEFRNAVKQDVLVPFAAARVPVWNDLIGRARRAAEGNFISVGRRRRFSVGPQIPGDGLSKLVTAGERLLDHVGL